MIIFLPIELLITSLKNFLYPLSYYTGDTFCNVFHTLEYYAAFSYQYSSFFTNLFRYICIIHSEFLLEKGISVKVHLKHVFSKRQTVKVNQLRTFDVTMILSLNKMSFLIVYTARSSEALQNPKMGL